MPPIVHPCLCGHTCDTYPQMRYHRRKCEVWKNRPNPKELTKARRSVHRRARPEPTKCEDCGYRPGRHAPGCYYSQDEKARRELLERHGIDPRIWAAFLKVLGERYEDGWR